MSEWKESALGEVCELLDCLHKTPQYSSEGYPMVRVTDVKNGYLNTKDSLLVNPQVFKDFSKCYKPKIGDIVFTRVGSSGLSAIVKHAEEFCIGQNTTLILPKGIHPFFLFYYLISQDARCQIEGLTGGSTQQTISMASIRKITIPLPPLPEQKAIASVLSNLDDKINLLHHQNKTLEAIAETLFRQWFVEEAEEFEDGCLGDVIELLYGKGLKKEIRSGNGYPVVGSSGIVDYHDDYLVEGPGIVIGRKGTLGKVIYLHDNFHPIDTTYYVKSKVNSVGLLYEFFLLKTLNLEELNSDSAVPGLNRDIALSTEIKIPPEKRLHQFNVLNANVFSKLRLNNTQISGLQKMRDTLLPKLMSGEVRVSF